MPQSFELDFGSPSDTDFYVGDWNGNGVDDLAYRRSKTFTLLNIETRQTSQISYGIPGDEVLVGDWDGNGTDTFAVRRGNRFFVKNSVSSGPADLVIGYGKADDEVFVGDWDANGTDTFAVRRGNVFFARNTVTTGNADIVFGYGRAADQVLVGDWNGDGGDTFAVRRGNEIFLRNDFATAPAEFSFAFGRASDELYPGDWNNDNIDTFAVRRGNTTTEPGATPVTDPADVTAPVISGVRVLGVTATAATINWTTDEPATSAVSYGATAAHTAGTATVPGLVASHSVTLTNLTAGSTYHFQVGSVDAAGNGAVAADATFVTAAPPVPGAPVIDLWYGGYQPFGERGRAQRWVNVMGNVADPNGVASLSYRVNGGSSQSLSIGPDAVRLDEPGDFNIEIDRTSLPVGLSTVVISAVDGVGTSSSATVTVELFENAVGVPFSVDWSIESNILNTAQVVDGDWVIDGSEVRLADAAALGYDRLLAVGDQTWTDYEVTVPVRFEGHGDQWGTPQSGLPLFGLGLRWQGHTASGSLRPRHGIYPVGAYTWFRWDSTLSSGRYELSGNNGSPLIRANGTVVTGDELVIKARVQTIAGGTRYSVKYWDPADPEPAAWLLEIVEDNGPASGALALFTHHSDVRFGTISVTPL